MGVYLNGKNAYGLFREAFSLTYFVDKTDILNEFVPILELKNDSYERSGILRGRSLKYFHYQTAPLWQDDDGEYDSVFFWKGSG